MITNKITTQKTISIICSYVQNLNEYINKFDRKNEQKKRRLRLTFFLSIEKKGVDPSKIYPEYMRWRLAGGSVLLTKFNEVYTMKVFYFFIKNKLCDCAYESKHTHSCAMCNR
jgi:hypothetical protein